MFFPLILAMLPFASCLVGYDCEGESFNVTTISLLDMRECDTNNLEPEKEETYIQLMQLSDFDQTPAI